MINLFKQILSKSETLNTAFGNVLFETPKVHGQSSRAFMNWRLKEQLDGEKCLIGCKLISDSHIGPEGSPTNYINFDVEGARQLRDDLNKCINQYEMLFGDGK